MGMHGSVIVSRPSTAAEFYEPNAKEMLQYSKRLREYFDDDEFKYKPKNRGAKNAAPKGHQHSKHSHKH
jgi:hypothetical protein